MNSGNQSSLSRLLNDIKEYYWGYDRFIKREHRASHNHIVYCE
jgi:hypothetical protein